MNIYTLIINNAGPQRTREGFFKTEKIADFERVNQNYMK